MGWLELIGTPSVGILHWSDCTCFCCLLCHHYDLLQTDLTKNGSIWKKRNKFEHLFLIQNYLQIPCWWCKLLNKQIRNPSNTTSTRQWWQHSLMYSPYSFYRWPCQLRHWEPAFPVNVVFPDTNSPLVNSLWRLFCAWSIWERWWAWYCQPLHQYYHRPELK